MFTLIHFKECAVETPRINPTFTLTPRVRKRAAQRHMKNKMRRRKSFSEGIPLLPACNLPVCPYKVFEQEERRATCLQGVQTLFMRPPSDGLLAGSAPSTNPGVQWRPTNPSITYSAAHSCYWVVLRLVDYMLRVNGAYQQSSADGSFNTRNVLIRLSEDFKYEYAYELIVPPHLLPHHAISKGIEDVRITEGTDFVGKSCLVLTGNTMQTAKDGFRRVVEVEIPHHAVTNPTAFSRGGGRPPQVLRPAVAGGLWSLKCSIRHIRSANEGSVHEKNWLIWTEGSADAPQNVIYLWHPFTLCTIQPVNESNSVLVKAKEVAPTATPRLAFMRGSTAPVRFFNPVFDGCHWLAMTHVAIDDTIGNDPACRKYLHYFVAMDESLTPVRLSQPFFFRSVDTEFAVSLTLCAGANSCVISYGVRDQRAYLVQVELDEIKELLGSRGCSVFVPWDASAALPGRDAMTAVQTKSPRFSSPMSPKIMEMVHAPERPVSIYWVMPLTDHCPETGMIVDALWDMFGARQLRVRKYGTPIGTPNASTITPRSMDGSVNASASANTSANTTPRSSVGGIGAGVEAASPRTDAFSPRSTGVSTSAAPSPRSIGAASPGAASPGAITPRLRASVTASRSRTSHRGPHGPHGAPHTPHTPAPSPTASEASSKAFSQTSEASSKASSRASSQALSLASNTSVLTPRTREYVKKMHHSFCTIAEVQHNTRMLVDADVVIMGPGFFLGDGSLFYVQRNLALMRAKDMPVIAWLGASAITDDEKASIHDLNDAAHVALASQQATLLVREICREAQQQELARRVWKLPCPWVLMVADKTIDLAVQASQLVPFSNKVVSPSEYLVFLPCLPNWNPHPVPVIQFLKRAVQEALEGSKSSKSITYVCSPHTPATTIRSWFQVLGQRYVAPIIANTHAAVSLMITKRFAKCFVADPWALSVCMCAGSIMCVHPFDPRVASAIRELKLRDALMPQGARMHPQAFAHVRSTLEDAMFRWVDVLHRASLRMSSLHAAKTKWLDQLMRGSLLCKAPSVSVEGLRAAIEEGLRSAIEAFAFKGMNTGEAGAKLLLVPKYNIQQNYVQAKQQLARDILGHLLGTHRVPYLYGLTRAIGNSNFTLEHAMSFIVNDLLTTCIQNLPGML